MLIGMWRGFLFSFGLLMTGISIVLFDQDLTNWYNQDRYIELRLQARAITNTSLGEYWFAIAIVTFLLTRFVFLPLARSDRFRERIKNVEAWSVYLFSCLLGSGLMLLLAKFLFGRQRPHISPNADQLVFNPFSLHWHDQSFPSGHAQVIFASAFVFSILFPRLRILFYMIAAGLAFTRVMTLQHFLSDVIFGAMIGYFGSIYVANLLSKKIPRPHAF